MVSLIVATDLENGIGKNGSIPWHCKGDLKNFKKLTQNSILIMGRKTIESLPTLKNRIIYGVTSQPDVPFLVKENTNNDIIPFNSIEVAINTALRTGGRVFVAGGGQVYKWVLKHMSYIVHKIYYSVIQDKYDCEVRFDASLLRGFLITDTHKYEGFVLHTFERKNTQERQYLQLLNSVLTTGAKRLGRNGITYSKFGEQLKFDLTRGFPLLTSKKMFFRGIVEEFLFFLRGETNTKLLEEKNVNIWKGNTNREFLDKIGMNERREGIMGPMYGYQWRFYNAEYDEESAGPKGDGIDQLQNVVELIKNDPHSRRMLMMTYNPEQAHKGVLYPCHSIILQFYVDEDFLSMFAYSRSSDLFLGLPFNIASYSLMLMVVAELTGKIAKDLTIGIGDAHIYKEHKRQCKEQIDRHLYTFPTLEINNLKSLGDIETLKAEDFSLLNYNHNDPLKAKMVA